MSLRPETCLKEEGTVNNRALTSIDVSLVFLVLIPLNPYLSRNKANMPTLHILNCAIFFLQREGKIYFVIVKATTK